jgi:hypothetical protein
MYTIISAVLRQQSKGDVMTSFCHSDRSAIYYQAGYPLLLMKHLHYNNQINWEDSSVQQNTL